MKITRVAWSVLAIIVGFSFGITSLSFAEEQTPGPSHQQLASVLNLQGESSAAAVIQNNGVIEFQGNALVDSVTKAMAASGMLQPDSTLAIPRELTNSVQETATPLALVEKDLQASTTSGGLALDALMNNASTLAREPMGVPLNPITPTSNMIPAVDLSQQAPDNFSLPIGEMACSSTAGSRLDPNS